MTVIPIDFATPEYDETVALRYEVLRKPLGLAYTVEQLSKEWSDIHLACYNTSSALIGCLILTKIDDNILKMRQVAVHPTYQGKGVGRKMVEASEAYSSLNGFEKIELNARATAIPFYLSLDYQTEGDIFVEVGIEHRKMVKIIR